MSKLHAIDSVKYEKSNVNHSNLCICIVLCNVFHLNALNSKSIVIKYIMHFGIDTLSKKKKKPSEDYCDNKSLVVFFFLVAQSFGDRKRISHIKNFIWSIMLFDWFIVSCFISLLFFFYSVIIVRIWSYTVLIPPITFKSSKMKNKIMLNVYLVNLFMYVKHVHVHRLYAYYQRHLDAVLLNCVYWTTQPRESLSRKIETKTQRTNPIQNRWKKIYIYI